MSVHLADRLALILEMIELIEARLEDFELTAFEKDRNERDLTAYRLQVIGEECHHLPSDMKARHPEIDWRAMYAMRNLISHNYGALIAKPIWEAATMELDPLENVCRLELEHLSE